ncbi:MAG: sugar transferase [Phycisphaerae bacterium]|jgi:lipopolysaccharide/colanic/teichoic acid biosynthesis glycosyltransferase|nr:sugar transferase [Phycisphaerae bacterium]
MPDIATLTIESYAIDPPQINVGRIVFDLTKRFIDIILGTIALILLSPIILLCALIVRFSSQGSVIYKQLRVGKDGRLFEMYKLRTMVADAEQSTGPVWAKADDPRVIPACRWMRRGHFDELPQIINVLKGEMSLVGPRPERPEISAELKEIFPDFNKRLAVRPGITGLAQIRNGYDETLNGVRRKLNFDIEYINTRGFGLELYILAATLPKFNDQSAH